MSFVQEAEQQLSVLKADEGLTVAQLDSWPKHRLDVLREAAGLFQELSYLSIKYQKWMLQQVHLSINLSFPSLFLNKLHSRRNSMLVPDAVESCAFCPYSGMLGAALALKSMLGARCMVGQVLTAWHCRDTALPAYQTELLSVVSGHMSRGGSPH